MKSLLAAALLLPCAAYAQTMVETPESAPVRVSLDARGEDVREVLATLFAQAKKPYALDASIKGKLYVKLDAMPYEKALAIVLAQSSLFAKVREGVVMIAPRKAAEPTKAVPTPVPATRLSAPKPTETTSFSEKAALARRVTTKMIKAPLADVFASFGDQTKVTIEVAPSVPAYRIDAFFAKSSLRYALDQICTAAGLKYEFSHGRILISKLS